MSDELQTEGGAGSDATATINAAEANAQQPMQLNANGGYTDDYIDIEVEAPQPVKVRVDLNRLTLGEVGSLQAVLAGVGSDGEPLNDLQKLEQMCVVLDKVLIGNKARSLPIMSFSRVIQFVLAKMATLGNRGN